MFCIHRLLAFLHRWQQLLELVVRSLVAVHTARSLCTAELHPELRLRFLMAAAASTALELVELDFTVFMVEVVVVVAWLVVLVADIEPVLPNPSPQQCPFARSLVACCPFTFISI